MDLLFASLKFDQVPDSINLADVEVWDVTCLTCACAHVTADTARARGEVRAQP